MPVREAQAVWNGSLKDGKGRLSFGAGAFDGAYSYSSRFEEGEGTNPEELIAAAHAGCFSMALASNLGKAGYPPDEIRTTASVHLQTGEGGPRIMRVDLRTEADVPGIDASAFAEQAEAAKRNCPVSGALAAIEITLEAALSG